MDNKRFEKENEYYASTHAIDYTCHIFYTLETIIGSLGSPNVYFPLNL